MLSTRPPPIATHYFSFLTPKLEGCRPTIGGAICASHHFVWGAHFFGQFSSGRGTKPLTIFDHLAIMVMDQHPGTKTAAGARMLRSNPYK